MKAMARFVTALLLALAIGLAVGTWTSSAWAGALDPYKAQGLVGERPDGYAGVVQSSAPGNVKAQVDQINAQRRAEYQKIAKEQNTSLEAVQAIFGKKLTERTSPGHYYMNAAGQWVKK